MRIRHLLLCCAAAPSVLLAPGARAMPDDAAATAVTTPAEKAALVRFAEGIDIPYKTFTLPNGLTVLVHTDHGAPVVHVSVWYDVGSKSEPAGRSGFAHLFEHLMFNGSENVPGDYMKPLSEVGAQVNGSTGFDRTNYYEMVPTQALERALFMESDRMGHLLGALDQATLDEQRGVVQNEKRQGDDGPMSIAEYKVRAALYPDGHPYGHSVIGSMKDLNAADLDDVRGWFKAHYGPNNAMLILSGDVDLAAAQAMVTRYFGDIPAGPRNVRPPAGPVPMTRTVSETVTAPVTNPAIIRAWPVPGADSPDGQILDAVMEVMSGGDRNVLNEHLVRERKLFQRLGATNVTMAQAGEFRISGTVSPGVDPKVAAAALDAEIAAFLRSTPAADAVDRFIARYTYGLARGLESVTARGATLGESAIAQGSPDGYKTALRLYARQTPASVMAVARRWLDRSHYALTVLPGARVTPKGDEGIDGSAAVATPATDAAAADALAKEKAAVAATPAATPAAGRRGPLPAVAPPGDARFPPIEHARLSNGIPVAYARYPSVPFTQVYLRIDGGRISEPRDQMGTMSFMYSMMGAGFAGHDEHWIGQRKERLGVSLGAGAGKERSSVSLDAPDTSLPAALDMMHEMLTAPDFPAEVLERSRRDQLNFLGNIRLDANTLLNEVMQPRVDAGSPYNPIVMYDDVAAIRRIDRAGIVRAFDRWVRPEHAALMVVSDKPLAELMPLLERALGTWTARGVAQPVPPVRYTPQPGKPEVVLVDLPGAVQASVMGSENIPITDRDPNEAFNLGNNILGADFTARINMNLRETRHWTYGAFAFASPRRYGSTYTVSAQIQQDKVGPAIAEAMKEVTGILTDRPITAEEFARSKSQTLGGVATRYSSRYSVLAALTDIDERDRADDYPARASERYRAVTRDDADRALHAQLEPQHWIWGIVGNAAIIRPQLDALGLPVTVIPADKVLPPLK